MIDGRRHTQKAGAIALFALPCLVTEAASASEGTILGIGSLNAVGASLIMGMAVFALTTALMHLRSKRHWQAKEARLLIELAAVQAEHERIHAVASGERQLIISWPGRHAEPVMDGEWGFSQTGQALAFGTWARPEDAAR